MSVTHSSATGPQAASEIVFFGSENMTQITRGYERLVRGFIDAAAQQVEEARSWMAGGMEDISLLAQARTPDAFVHAELEVFRRRSERAIHAAQRLTEQMSRVWSETSSLTQSAANGAAAHGTGSAAAEPASGPATALPVNGVAPAAAPEGAAVAAPPAPSILTPVAAPLAASAGEPTAPQPAAVVALAAGAATPMTEPKPRASRASG